MKRTILLFIIFVGILSHTKAQWIQANGLYGGDIRCLVKIGPAIYAGSQYGGIFVTNDNGDNWNPISNGLPGGVSVNHIIRKDNYLYAGTSHWALQGQGVYRSADNGNTWVQKNSGIQTGGTFHYPSISGLANTTSHIFASTAQNGIYRSSDNGEAWTMVFDPYGPDSVLRLIHSLCNAGETLFAGGDHFIYRSTDQGITWVAINAGFPSGVIIYQLVSSGSDLYARTSHGFFWSPANGDFWVGINNGITQPTGATSGSFSAEGATLYASTHHNEGPKTYKSVNKGITWENIPALSGSSRVLALLNSGNFVFAGHLGMHGITSDGGGVLRSVDGGSTWSNASNGLSGINVTAIDANETDIFAGTRFFSGIYKSSDQGVNFTKSYLPGTTSNSEIHALLCTGTNIFAGVNHTTGVFISTNNGQTWAATASTGQAVRALGANSSFIFAGTTNQGMRRSSNNGASWTTINTGLPGINERSIRAITISGSMIYIGNFRGVFRSSNNGTNWTAANGGTGSPGNVRVNSIAVKGDTIFAGADNGIIRSFNNGTSWTLVSSNINIMTTNAICIHESIIYAGGMGGVFKSDNWGETWVSMNQSFPMVPEIFALKVYNGKLFAGTYGQALWYFDLTVPQVPENRTVNGIILGNADVACYDATKNITVTNTSIGNGASAEFRAGVNIILGDGFIAQEGSYVLAIITDVYCTLPPAMLASEGVVVPAEIPVIAGTESMFRAYPNPTSGNFTLEISRTEASSKVFAELYNMMGNRMMQQEISGAGAYTVDLSAMPRGVYILRVIINGKTEMQKIIKQ